MVGPDRDAALGHTYGQRGVGFEGQAGLGSDRGHFSERVAAETGALLPSIFRKGSGLVGGSGQCLGLQVRGLQTAVGGDSSPGVAGSGKAWGGWTWVAEDHGLGSLGPLCSGHRALRRMDRWVWSWKESGAALLSQAPPAALRPRPHTVQGGNRGSEGKGWAGLWTRPPGYCALHLGPRGCLLRVAVLGQQFLGCVPALDLDGHFAAFCPTSISLTH